SGGKSPQWIALRQDGVLVTLTIVLTDLWIVLLRPPDFVRRWSLALVHVLTTFICLLRINCPAGLSVD
ncbi:hypothetical protein, partial [Mesorhizobium captivum]|uniref:hypothetical protein n=1 Tax=Mesorhizobium captivum TaxID=3072319 RepID=UPI002A24ACDF